MPIAMIFFVLLLAFAIMWRFPVYRWAIAAGLMLVSVVFGAYLLLSEPAFKSQSAALPASLLELRDITINADPRFVTIRGQVHNLSTSANLLDMSLRLSALDCPAEVEPIAECIVIGADDAVARVSVPAGQLRAFEATFLIRNLPRPDGVLRWHYLITDTRAQPQ